MQHTTETIVECSSSLWSRPYPPVNRDGVVHEHDKPYFYYGNLGKSYD